MALELQMKNEKLQKKKQAELGEPHILLRTNFPLQKLQILHRTVLQHRLEVVEV